MSIALLCYIIAFVLFVLSVIPGPSRAWMTGIGLAFFVCGHMLAGVAFKSV